MKKRDQFLTAAEAAKILKVNVMTIYRYIKAKRLPAYKIGKEYRVVRKDFDQFIASHRVKK